MPLVGTTCLCPLKNMELNIYGNNIASIINIYFYETFSTPNLQSALQSLDTLSDVRIKAFMPLF